MACFRLRLGLSLLICWPGAVQAQNLGGGNGGTPDISVIRILAALLVCLAAAFTLALMIRARNGGLRLSGKGWLSGAIARSRRIEVIETRRASPHADICLVRCDDEEYLLLCGPSAQSVLRWPNGTRPADRETSSEE